ncbi:MAG: recombination protein RecR [Ruminococcus sp.]|nr:recombination protein RecR [Candidatus Apopatosoma intestinale]
MDYILPLQKLIEQFCKLKGVGARTATRYALSVLDMSEADAAALAESILDAKRNVRPCEVCGNLTDRPVCEICSDARRDKSIVCVVEDAKTVMAVERVREYHGLYHVLGGAISPADGIGPDQLRIGELLARIGEGDIKELILATNPDVAGEATAMYLARLVAPLGIRTTRLAYGVPVGASIEYADEVTLMRAIAGRREMENGFRTNEVET